MDMNEKRKEVNASARKKSVETRKQSMEPVIASLEDKPYTLKKSSTENKWNPLSALRRQSTQADEAGDNDKAGGGFERIMSD
jgi:hypothetical protein